MSGYRWDLPIHLCDALFATGEGGCSTTITPRAAIAAGFEPQQLLHELGQVIEDGYACHALQRTPHLVLLDVEYYRSSLQPLLAKWALLWLHDNFVGVCACSNSQLLAYMAAGPEGLEEMRTDVSLSHLLSSPHAFCFFLTLVLYNGPCLCLLKVESGLLPESKKLLNLSRDWVRSFLPHVFSKINRVSFGILNELDLTM